MPPLVGGDDAWAEVRLSPRPAGPAVIALAGDWNAMPRKPRLQSTGQVAYQKAAAQVLAERGLGRAKVKVLQVIRIDLEGDGIEEALFAAGNLDPAHPRSACRPGDYSFVAIRRLVGGAVRTQVLVGDFHKAADETRAPTHSQVAAVLDLNGDGTMEVVTSGQYFWGAGLDVWALQGGSLKRVLEGWVED